MSKLSSGVRSKLITAYRSMKDRLNAPYILALVPPLLVAQYNIHHLPPLMFGFILLLINRHKLATYRRANPIQRDVGAILALSSFVLYCILLYFIHYVPFYGEATAYIAYIFGLFLTFFDRPALRESLTPIFIIMAATSMGYVSEWLELLLSPHIIPLFTSLVGTTSNILGVKATVQYPNRITLHALRGELPLIIIWACVGVYGVLVFSILLVLVLSEEPASLKTKMLWSVAGIIGALVLNVIRVVIILVIAYYYDFNVAELVIHPYLGYALFLTWLMLFLYLFSNRQHFFKKLRFKRPEPL